MNTYDVSLNVTVDDMGSAAEAAAIGHEVLMELRNPIVHVSSVGGQEWAFEHGDDGSWNVWRG